MTTMTQDSTLNSQVYHSLCTSFALRSCEWIFKVNYADMDNIGGNMTTLLCTLSLYRPVLRRDLPFHHLQEEECEFFDLQCIIISARCVCACVCPQLILHTSRLISLILFFTVITEYSRTSCGCDDSQFYEKPILLTALF